MVDVFDGEAGSLQGGCLALRRLNGDMPHERTDIRLERLLEIGLEVRLKGFEAVDVSLGGEARSEREELAGGLVRVLSGGGN